MLFSLLSFGFTPLPSFLILKMQGSCLSPKRKEREKIEFSEEFLPASIKDRLVCVKNFSQSVKSFSTFKGFREMRGKFFGLAGAGPGRTGSR